MRKSIIFDLDGTLWDSRQGIRESWNEIYEKHTGIKNHFSDSDISGVLGKTMTDIADILFKEFGENEMKVATEAYIHENEYLCSHPQTLFPKLAETLEKLNKKYDLFIVSNCQKGYIEAFYECMGLKYLFKDQVCWGDNLLLKGDNIKYIMEKNGISDAIYVGDTLGDEMSTRQAGIPFVHAEYGFGSAEKPDAVLHTFEDLLEVSDTLLK